MPPLRMRMICSPRPSASMTFAHSFSDVWLESLFIADGVDRSFPDRHSLHQRVLVVDRRLQLARKPFGDVLRGRIDAVEWRYVVVAAVVELLRQHLELP